MRQSQAVSRIGIPEPCGRFRLEKFFGVGPILVASILALAPAHVSAAIQRGSVEVAAVVGEATLIDANGRRTPLSKGVVFQEGARIETGKDSTVDLDFSNGARVSIQPESLVALKVFSQVVSPDATPAKARELGKEPSVSIVQMEVYRGKASGEVRKLSPDSHFTIKTPTGNVRIR